MLTDEEQRLVRKYCLLPIAAVAALCTAIGLGVVLVVLEAVDHVAMHARDVFMPGLYLYLALTAACLAFAVYGFLTPRLGMQRTAWLDISRKMYLAQIQAQERARAAQGGPYLEGDAPDVGPLMPGTMGVAAATSREAYRAARVTANFFGVSLPRPGKVVLAVVLVPVLILTAVYVPPYVSSIRTARAGQRAAAETMDRLQSLLQAKCWDVYADDPLERYSEYGYDISGYLNDSWDEYLFVTVSPAGQVSELSYHVQVDVTRPKEENIGYITASLKSLQTLLAGADLPLAAEDLLDEYPLPEAFLQAFREGSYYEPIDMTARGSAGSHVYFSYFTTPEEEYTEYSSSSIYVYVGEY